MANNTFLPHSWVPIFHTIDNGRISAAGAQLTVLDRTFTRPNVSEIRVRTGPEVGTMDRMQRTVTATVSAPAKQVFAIVSDLATYPQWLDLVATAEPFEKVPGQPPAWSVTIRAKVGPFARSKKLRMVRLKLVDADSSEGWSIARFERDETDNRNHSTWAMEAKVAATNADTCAVEMNLRYDGGLWTAPLEPVLGAFISNAGKRLDHYANQ